MAGLAHRKERALIAAVIVLATAPAMAGGDAAQHDVTVVEREGVYHVDARFAVPESAPQVMAVLTDYERIPRYIPDVRSSVVLERAADRVVVEQDAVARVMVFSRRLHLVLDVQEEAAAIRFRDRCKQSFSHYEGSWQITSGPGGASIVYRLEARPAFDVPGFLLKRLLKRDARIMIERLRAEIAGRSRRPEAELSGRR